MVVELADTAVLDSTAVVVKMVVMAVNKAALDSIVVNRIVIVAQIADSCSLESSFFSSNQLLIVLMNSGSRIYMVSPHYNSSSAYPISEFYIFIA